MTDSSGPDLTGRTAIVTGATGGLGLEIARVLASCGARVLVGARDAVRGAAALEVIASAATGPQPELLRIDLSSLESVAIAAAEASARTGDRVDILVNNAGVMAPPRSFSADGFELQWATNVLGAAALTWRLLPAIEAADGARVVFVSSTRHSSASLTEAGIRSDLRGENYRGFEVYGRTKLADLVLSRELDKHFRRIGADARSLAAHPGFSATGIVQNGFAGLPRFIRPVANWGARALGQRVEVGAQPILFAATSPEAEGGGYYGPQSLGGLRGRTGPAKRAAQSLDDATGAMVSRLVAELIGIPAPH